VLSETGYLRSFAKEGQLAVITYHGVKPPQYVSRDSMLDGSLVSIDQFRTQLRFLKQRYAIVSPELVREWLEDGRKLPKRAVLLTCDDGLQNAVTLMLPVVIGEGLSCLFFVTGASLKTSPKMLWYEQLYLLMRKAQPSEIEADFLDSPPKTFPNRRELWWKLVKKLSTVEYSERLIFIQRLQDKLGSDGYLDVKPGSSEGERFLLATSCGVQELATHGMTIGAHTLSHPVLALAPDECARKEIADTKHSLELLLGKRVWAFAYPFGNAGSISSRELNFAESAGYTAAFVNVGGGFGAAMPRFALPRVHVTADMSLSELEAHVSGFYRSMRRPEAMFADEGCSHR
jgi:peptidoglycan/xylan/chitin deacetylase (PgdA/CDA1 family)